MVNMEDFFQVLCSPYRRDILQLLLERDMSAGDITNHFGVSQPSISRHLDILRRSGLVTSRKQANQIIYSLERPALREGVDQMERLFEKV